MNKLLFLGKVTNLYAEDYQRLQDTIDANLKTLYKVTVNNPDQPAIIRGFQLAINSIDATKIDIYHISNTGAIVTGDNNILESSKTYVAFSLPEYVENEIYYIYAKVVITQKSFDPQTGTYVSQPRRLDFSTYDYVYDTEFIDYEPAVYTQSEYNALTLEEKKNLICLGTVTAHGVGNALTDLNVSSPPRIYAAARQTEGQITESNISDTIRMPQYWVKSTSKTMGVAENDNYIISDINQKFTLVDDLNDLRTQIRLIKGTASYRDQASGSLANLDPLGDSLHSNGVDNQNANSMKVTVVSGYTVRVQSGKGLIHGKVVSTPSTTLPQFTITPVPLTVVNQETGYTVPPDGEPGWSLYFQLSRNSSGGYTIGPLEGNNTPTVEVYYLGEWHTLSDSSVDYTSDGRIRVSTEATDPGQPLRVSYRYGRARCDLIYVTYDNQFQIVQGVPLASNKTIPPIPNPPSNSVLLLAAIHVKPFATSITSSDIIDLRTMIQPVRDIVFLPSDSYILNPIYQTNKLTYRDNLDNVVNPTISNGYWSQVIVSGDKRIQTSVPNSQVHGYVYCPQNSELWILREKFFDSGSITLYFQDDPTQDAFSSTIISVPRISGTAEGPYLQRLKTGITRGYHKFVIASGTGNFGVYGFIIGDLSVFYKGFVPEVDISGTEKLVKFDSLSTKIEIVGDRKGVLLTEPISSSTTKHFCTSSGVYLQRSDAESQHPISRKISWNAQTPTSNDYNVLFNAISENTRDKISFILPTTLGSFVNLKWLRFNFSASGGISQQLQVIIHNEDSSQILFQTSISTSNILTDGSYTYIVLNYTIATGLPFHIHVKRAELSGDATKIKTSSVSTPSLSESLYALYITPNPGLYPSNDSIRLYKLDNTLLIPETQTSDDVLSNNIPPDERMLFPIPVDFSNDTTWNNWDYPGLGVGIDYITGRIKFSTDAYNLINTP